MRLPPRLLARLLPWAAACALPAAGCARAPTCFDGAEVSERLVSPSDGVTLRVPWVPLLLNLPERYHDAEVSLCLDGAPWEDPGASLGHRRSWWGDGVDYLAALDLQGLEPGPHTLEAQVIDPKSKPLRYRGSFTVERPPHRVTLRVAEGRAARVIVLKDGAPLNLAGPDAEAADPGGRDHGLSSVFVLGEATLHVDPGRYTFLAVRSVFDEVDLVEVDIAGDAEVALALPPAVEDPGWLSADLHVHTARSPDAFLPNQLRWQSLAAAGLHVAVLTDHDLVTAPDAALLALQAERGAPHGVQGIEGGLFWPDANGDGNRESIGHMNAFPVHKRSAGPTPATTLESLEGHLAEWRQRQRAHPFDGQDALILQLNHPRGIHFVGDEDPREIHDLFGQEGFDRSAPVGEGPNAWMTQRSADGEARAMDFDAIELINRASWPLYLEVRQDWFALLNQGWRLTATGNSDTHAMEAELAGFPVNLVDCPPAPELDLGCFIEALQAGRVRVTTGPVVDLSVGEAGLGELASAGPEATVRVQAAPWVPVSELRLVVNGEVVERVDLSEAPRSASGVLDARFSFALPASAGDAWVIAEAGRGLEEALSAEALGLYAQVAPAYSPVGFTNPVYVDGDGDGAWTPPGL